MKAVLATEIGTRVSLRRYWGDGVHDTKYGYHNCHTYLEDILHPIPEGDHPHYGGDLEDHPDDIMWPTHCEECGEPVPADASKQVFNERLYDTPSGRLEPGCLYWITWYPEGLYWDNHKGPYLAAIVPSGDHWVIDSRASNCALPEDRLHRCWVRKGEPPNVHVDKEGLTCQAGAGSVIAGEWHGFLHNGEFHT